MHCYLFGLVLSCLFYLARGQTTNRNGQMNDTPPKTDLYFLGLVCFNGARQHGEVVRPGMEMAFEDINAREDILPDYELKIIWTDTFVIKYYLSLLLCGKSRKHS